MKHRPLALGIIVLGLVVFGTSLAEAQTTGTGPYYATPSWDQKLQCDTPATCPRFIVLSNWNGEAVLDRETGLVWQRSPMAPCTNPLFCRVLTQGTVTWNQAQLYCNFLIVGNRGGWRVPTVQELHSLIDYANTQSPRLPPGHPFTGVQSSFYWSATAYSVPFNADPNQNSIPNAWVVFFFFVNDAATDIDYQDNHHFVWCVRSGQGVNPQ